MFVMFYIPQLIKLEIKKVSLILFTFIVFFYCEMVFANNPLSDDVVTACVSRLAVKADDNTSVGELREKCRKQKLGSLKERVVFEEVASSNPFAILPHKPNYLLPITYSKINHTTYEELLNGNELDNTEIKFQVSLKYIAVEDLLLNGLDVHLAFTGTSWWQAYNSDISAPFRETNYEPELIFNYQKPFKLFGLSIDNSYLALNHQSNGQAGDLSRSWNRVIGGLVFNTDEITWAVRAWWRIPEEDKLDQNDPSGDDNPNIEGYIGYGEIGALWQISDGHNVDMVLRNNLNNDNKGSVLLGWSFPLTKHLRGYVQYFNGYGESLIYFDQHTERFGVGVKLTDWL